MYITFFNSQKGCMVTYSTGIVTDRNIAFVNTINTLLVPLQEEALKLLDQGIEKKYSTYYKQKTNGSRRRIDVPDEELKNYMRKVVRCFTHYCQFYFPDCMYAYVRGKSTKQLANLHKDAKLILKTDIRNFFNSCTGEFIINSMCQVYPFCLLEMDLLIPIVQACLLNNTLPQGAPTSPLLSNIAMIPFVYEANLKFSNQCTEKDKVHSDETPFSIHFSIYADDIILSLHGSPNLHYHTRANKAMDLLESLLVTMTPLRLNDKKTKIIKLWRSNGIWITGLMVNRNHQVTIGHRNKQRLKAIIFSFLSDTKNGKIWTSEQVHQICGIVSYWHHIEPEYVDMIIHKYNQKLGMNYHDEIGNIIYS